MVTNYTGNNCYIVALITTNYQNFWKIIETAKRPINAMSISRLIFRNTAANKRCSLCKKLLGLTPAHFIVKSIFV